MQKIIIDQSIYCQTSPNFMNGLCLNKCQNILKFLFSLNISVEKNFSAEDCLVSILANLKSATDNKKSFGACLTDLSKAFECFSHDLLIAKLNNTGLTCQLWDLYIVILKVVCKEQK